MIHNARWSQCEFRPPSSPNLKTSSPNGDGAAHHEILFDQSDDLNLDHSTQRQRSNLECAARRLLRREILGINFIELHKVVNITQEDGRFDDF